MYSLVYRGIIVNVTNVSIIICSKSGEKSFYSFAHQCRIQPLGYRVYSLHSHYEREPFLLISLFSASFPVCNAIEVRNESESETKREGIEEARDEERESESEIVREWKRRRERETKRARKSERERERDNKRTETRKVRKQNRL